MARGTTSNSLRDVKASMKTTTTMTTATDPVTMTAFDPFCDSLGGPSSSLMDGTASVASSSVASNSSTTADRKRISAPTTKATKSRKDAPEGGSPETGRIMTAVQDDLSSCFDTSSDVFQGSEASQFMGSQGTTTVHRNTSKGTAATATGSSTLSSCSTSLSSFSSSTYRRRRRRNEQQQQQLLQSTRPTGEGTVPDAIDGAVGPLHSSSSMASSSRTSTSSSTISSSVASSLLSASQTNSAINGMMRNQQQLAAERIKQLAEAYMEEEAYDRALRAYEEVLLLYQQNVGVMDRIHAAETLRQIAKLQLNHLDGDPDIAIECFQECERLYTSCVVAAATSSQRFGSVPLDQLLVDVMQQRAYMLVRHGKRVTEAIDVHEQIVEHLLRLEEQESSIENDKNSPDKNKGQPQIGQYFQRISEDSRLKALTKSLQRLGSLYLQLEQPAEALQSMEDALRLMELRLQQNVDGKSSTTPGASSPRSLHKAMSLLCMKISGIHYSEERLEQAIDFLERGMEHQTHFVPSEGEEAVVTAWTNLGILLEEMESWEDALQAQRHLLGIRTRFELDGIADSHVSIAKILEWMGQPEEALREYQRALELYQKESSSDQSAASTMQEIVARISSIKGAIAVVAAASMSTKRRLSSPPPSMPPPVPEEKEEPSVDSTNTGTTEDDALSRALNEAYKFYELSKSLHAKESHSAAKNCLEECRHILNGMEEDNDDMSVTRIAASKNLKIRVEALWQLIENDETIVIAMSPERSFKKSSALVGTSSTQSTAGTATKASTTPSTLSGMSPEEPGSSPCASSRASVKSSRKGNEEGLANITMSTAEITSASSSSISSPPREVKAKQEETSMADYVFRTEHQHDDAKVSVVPSPMQLFAAPSDEAVSPTKAPQPEANSTPKNVNRSSPPRKAVLRRSISSPSTPKSFEQEQRRPLFAPSNDFARGIGGMHDSSTSPLSMPSFASLESSAKSTSGKSIPSLAAQIRFNQQQASGRGGLMPPASQSELAVREGPMSPPGTRVASPNRAPLLPPNEQSRASPENSMHDVLSGDLSLSPIAKSGSILMSLPDPPEARLIDPTPLERKLASGKKSKDCPSAGGESLASPSSHRAEELFVNARKAAPRELDIGGAVTDFPLPSRERLPPQTTVEQDHQAEEVEEQQPPLRKKKTLRSLLEATAQPTDGLQLTKSFDTATSPRPTDAPPTAPDRALEKDDDEDSPSPLSPPRIVPWRSRNRYEIREEDIVSDIPPIKVASSFESALPPTKKALVPVYSSLLFAEGQGLLRCRSPNSIIHNSTDPHSNAIAAAETPTRHNCSRKSDDDDFKVDTIPTEISTPNRKHFSTDDSISDTSSITRPSVSVVETSQATSSGTAQGVVSYREMIRRRGGLESRRRQMLRNRRRQMKAKQAETEKDDEIIGPGATEDDEVTADMLYSESSRSLPLHRQPEEEKKSDSAPPSPVNMSSTDFSSSSLVPLHKNSRLDESGMSGLSSIFENSVSDVTAILGPLERTDDSVNTSQDYPLAHVWDAGEEVVERMERQFAITVTSQNDSRSVRFAKGPTDLPAPGLNGLSAEDSIGNTSLPSFGTMTSDLDFPLHMVESTEAHDEDRRLDRLIYTGGNSVASQSLVDASQASEASEPSDSLFDDEDDDFSEESSSSESEDSATNFFESWEREKFDSFFPAVGSKKKSDQKSPKLPFVDRKKGRQKRVLKLGPQHEQPVEVSTEKIEIVHFDPDSPSTPINRRGSEIDFDQERFDNGSISMLRSPPLSPATQSVSSSVKSPRHRIVQALTKTFSRRRLRANNKLESTPEDDSPQLRFRRSPEANYKKLKDDDLPKKKQSRKKRQKKEKKMKDSKEPVKFVRFEATTTKFNNKTAEHCPPCTSEQGCASTPMDFVRLHDISPDEASTISGITFRQEDLQGENQWLWGLTSEGLQGWFPAAYVAQAFADVTKDFLSAESIHKKAQDPPQEKVQAQKLSKLSAEVGDGENSVVDNGEEVTEKHLERVQTASPTSTTGGQSSPAKSALRKAPSRLENLATPPSSPPREKPFAQMQRVNSNLPTTIDKDRAPSPHLSQIAKEFTMNPSLSVPQRNISARSTTTKSRMRLNILQKKCESLKVTRGLEDSDVATTLVAIAMLQTETGETVTACESLFEALRIQQAIGDPVQMARTLHVLGTIYSKVEDHESALACYNDAQRIERRVYGPDNPENANTLNRIGLVYADVDEFYLAMEKHQQALQVLKASFGEDLNHPAVAQTLIHIGEVYYKERNSLDTIRSQTDDYGSFISSGMLDVIARAHAERGSYKMALSFLEEKMQLIVQDTGGRSGEMVATLYSIAILSCKAGVFTEAIGYYEQALQIQKGLGCRDGEVATAKVLIATVDSYLGNYRSSLKLLSEAKVVFDNMFGQDSDAVADTLQRMGSVELKLFDLKAARPHLEQALEIQMRVFGLDDIATLETRSEVAELMKHEFKLDEALTILKDILERQKNIHGTFHPDLADTLLKIGEVFALKGGHSNAIQMFQESFKMRERFLGTDHPMQATTLHQMALIYVERRKYEKANSLIVSVLDIRRETLGESHIDFALTLSTLARCQAHLGTISDATKAFGTALPLAEDAVGELHPSVGDIHVDRAVVYLKKCQFDKARKSIQRGLEIFSGAGIHEDHPRMRDAKVMLERVDGDEVLEV